MSAYKAVRGIRVGSVVSTFVQAVEFENFYVVGR